MRIAHDFRSERRGPLRRFGRMAAAAATAMALLLMVGGCYTQVPHPMTYRNSNQQVMQAARHWDILAQDVAYQIIRTIRKYPDFNEKSISVPLSGDTAFAEIFRDCLIARLTEYGATLLDSNEGDIKIATKARVLSHTDRRVRRVPPYFFTTLEMGILVLRDVANLWPALLPTGPLLDAYSGIDVGGIPDREVLITTRLTYQNQILNQQANIYYINPKDWWHYDTAPYGPQTTKTFQLTAEE